MRRKTSAIIIIILLFSANLFAGNDEAIKVADKFKDYFNSTLQKVKNEENSNLKREILNNSLQKVDLVLTQVSAMPGVPQKDIKALNELKQNYREYYNELNGLKGYSKVGDNQLNNFASYMVQSGEQADKYVYISITTLLLIIIILILIL